jgi:hypothetical protein
MPECVFRNVKIHVEVSLLLLFFAFLLSGKFKLKLGRNYYNEVRRSCSDKFNHL